MINLILFNIALALPSLLNAAVPVHFQPVVAVKDESSEDFGTDADTATFPNAGMNTMPTKEVGNENNTVNQNAPIAKPDEAPDLNSTPPPSFKSKKNPIENINPP